MWSFGHWKCTPHAKVESAIRAAHPAEISGVGHSHTIGI
jgi:hypothetical protein